MLQLIIKDCHTGFFKKANCLLFRKDMPKTQRYRKFESKRMGQGIPWKQYQKKASETVLIKTK